MESIIPTQSGYTRLIEGIHTLQVRISERIALRDDMLYHIYPALKPAKEALRSGNKRPAELLSEMGEGE